MKKDQLKGKDQLLENLPIWDRNCDHDSENCKHRKHQQRVTHFYHFLFLFKSNVVVPFDLLFFQKLHSHLFLAILQFSILIKQMNTSIGKGRFRVKSDDSIDKRLIDQNDHRLQTASHIVVGDLKPFARNLVDCSFKTPNLVLNRILQKHSYSVDFAFSDIRRMNLDFNVSLLLSAFHVRNGSYLSLWVFRLISFWSWLLSFHWFFLFDGLLRFLWFLGLLFGILRRRLLFLRFILIRFWTQLFLLWFFLLWLFWLWLFLLLLFLLCLFLLWFFLLWFFLLWFFFFFWLYLSKLWFLYLFLWNFFHFFDACIVRYLKSLLTLFTLMRFPVTLDTVWSAKVSDKVQPCRVQAEGYRWPIRNSH